MHSKTARSLVVAFFLGAVAVGAAGAPDAALAAGAPKITNKAVGEPLQAAIDLHNRGQITQAIAKAREAHGAAGITGAEAALIDRLVAAWMLEAKDYRGALTAYESLADRGIDRENSLQAALGAAMQTNNMAKVQELAGKMPGGAGNADLFIAQGLYSAKKFNEAIAKAKPFVDRTPPNQQALQITYASCFEMKNEACRRSSLEALLRHYPSPDRWRDLIKLTSNEKGLSDEDQLELYRIRMLVGDLKTSKDYSDMAQQALIVGYPAEAKTVVEKGIAAKVLVGDRVPRLADMANRQAADDVKAIAALQQQAQADATGNADAKLGLKLLSHGKNAEGQAALEQGLKEGKPADPDVAKIGLGRALLAQNKKAEAVRAFNSVPRTSTHGSVARLWSLYAQQS
jgi:hypothetical protein